MLLVATVVTSGVASGPDEYPSAMRVALSCIIAPSSGAPGEQLEQAAHKAGSSPVHCPKEEKETRQASYLLLCVQVGPAAPLDIWFAEEWVGGEGAAACLSVAGRVVH